MLKEVVTEQSVRLHGEQAVKEWKPCRKHQSKSLVMIVLCVDCASNLYEKEKSKHE